MMLMTVSPVSYDAYCTEYICWDLHHTDRDFLIKWVWPNSSDEHHETVPNDHIEKQVKQFFK